MKKLLMALLACLTIVGMKPSYAEEGDWLTRLHAATISPNKDSRLDTTTNALLGTTAMPSGAEFSASDNTIPKIDISYYFTKHNAKELILAFGTKHNVRFDNDQLTTIDNKDFDSADAQPPTLTLQYHFNPDELFDPYISADLNYTRMLDRNGRETTGAINGSKVRIDRDNWGYALQAGIDINLKDNWLVNVDVKYLDINTDIELKDAAAGHIWRKIDSLNIDPWLSTNV